jgi:hypothetical protein
MNQILNEASKMFEKLTIHLNECEDYNCCVRQIANELLLGDKDNYGSCESVTAKDNPEILRNQRGQLV